MVIKEEDEDVGVGVKKTGIRAEEVDRWAVRGCLQSQGQRHFLVIARKV